MLYHSTKWLTSVRNFQIAGPPVFSGPGCQQDICGAHIEQNGLCVDFNEPYLGIKVAGGSGGDCLLQVFANPDCVEQSVSAIGPLSDPNLRSCIGPMPFELNGSNILFYSSIASARIVNCD
jgi:hypothetical protein